MVLGYQLRELRALLDTYLHGFYIPSTVVLQNTPISQLIEKNQRVLVHLEDPEAGTQFTEYFFFSLFFMILVFGILIRLQRVCIEIQMTFRR